MTRQSMVKVTTKDIWRTWSKVTSILTTAISIQLRSLTSTTWRLFLKLLVQSKSLLITNPFPEAEEVFSSYSFTLEQSVPSQGLVDGLIMSGLEAWFGTMNILLPSIWDTSKSDTSLISLVPSLLYSTMSTLDMKPNNSAQCGLMSLRRSNWDT